MDALRSIIVMEVGPNLPLFFEILRFLDEYSREIEHLVEHHGVKHTVAIVKLHRLALTK